MFFVEERSQIDQTEITFSFSLRVFFKSFLKNTFLSATFISSYPLKDKANALAENICLVISADIYDGPLAGAAGIIIGGFVLILYSIPVLMGLLLLGLILMLLYEHVPWSLYIVIPAILGMAYLFFQGYLEKKRQKEEWEASWKEHRKKERSHKQANH